MFEGVTSSCVDAKVAPTTDNERKMAGCWERVLRKDVCVETPFMAYGGHSLTALALRSEISKTFGVFLPAALITNELCTVKWLLVEIQKRSSVEEEETEVSLPLVLERTISTFFHMDGVDPRMYAIVHAFTRFLPESSAAPMNFYYVPS